MAVNTELQTLQTEMEAGIALAKCQKCGCMRETLESIAALRPEIETDEARALLQRREQWAVRMLPIQYSCLGCDHCYAGVAQNALTAAFPTVTNVAPLACDFQVTPVEWPPVVGEYFVLDPSAPVAVSTLASIELAGQLAQRKPQGLAIVGKTETENIGLDKVIKNVIANAALRFLIVAGNESQGHRSGQTLLALARAGVDDKGRVIGSRGKRPILRNVSRDEIDAFRQQVQVVDLVGCENLDEISAQIEELSQQVAPSCRCSECSDQPVALSSATPTPIIAAVAPDAPVIMDKAGYFLVIPLADRGAIHVEHYAYDDQLLHTLESTNARALYLTVIDHGWVSELSHAAYLGKELAKAELSMQHGFKYVQDGA